MPKLLRNGSFSNWLSVAIIVADIGTVAYSGQRAYARLSTDDCRTVNTYNEDQQLVSTSTECC